MLIKSDVVFFCHSHMPQELLLFTQYFYVTEVGYFFLK